jgi:hypothetical protein
MRFTSTSHNRRMADENYIRSYTSIHLPKFYGVKSWIAEHFLASCSFSRSRNVLTKPNFKVSLSITLCSQSSTCYMLQDVLETKLEQQASHENRNSSLVDNNIIVVS